MAKGTEERSFKYKPRDRETVRERANMRGGGYDGIFKQKYKKYKMRDGKNIIRVLPPTWDDANHYGYDIYVNYSIGADNASYLSLSKMKKEADPIAEARREADREGDEKYAKQLAPRQRVVMWIIDRQDEDEGPQLLDAPFTVDKALANLSLDEDTKEVTMIDDPENGCDFRFYKEGKGLNTDYEGTKMKLLKPSPLHEDPAVQKDWLKFVAANPIPECLEFHNYDYIAQVFKGAAPKDEDDDDEKPSRRRSKPVDDDEDEQPKAKKRVVTDDEDDEPEAKPAKRRAAVDDDDEAEEKPAKRRAPVDDDDEPDEKPKTRPRSRAADDDDDAEEKPARKRPAVDDDDEPEEKPAKKRAKPAADDDDPEDDADDKPQKGESIRDRLKRRRAVDDDED